MAATPRVALSELVEAVHAAGLVKGATNVDVARVSVVWACRRFPPDRCGDGRRLKLNNEYSTSPGTMQAGLLQSVQQAFPNQHWKHITSAASPPSTSITSLGLIPQCQKPGLEKAQWR